MKKISLIIFCFTILICSYAQSDKELKAEAKQYTKNPEGLRKLKEEAAKSKKLRTRLNELEVIQMQCEHDIEVLRAEFDSLLKLLEKYKGLENNTPPPPPPVVNNSGIPQQGIAFTVQIGAYKNTNLSDYTNADLETQEGKVNKYILGVFRKYDEAEQLKIHLKNMGLKDAWIVSYKDGQRVKIEEVLTPEEIQKRKDRGY